MTEETQPKISPLEALNARLEALETQIADKDKTINTLSGQLSKTVDANKQLMSTRANIPAPDATPSTSDINRVDLTKSILASFRIKNYDIK